MGLKNKTVSNGIIAVSFCLIFLLFFISMNAESISEGIPLSRYRRENSKVMPVVMYDFVITAYCPGECCNGKWAGKTSTGITMNELSRRGIAIAAVDPSVILIGSRITYENRTYLAADVGSMIKGNCIDILVPDHESTFVFGKRTGATIYVERP